MNNETLISNSTAWELVFFGTGNAYHGFPVKEIVPLSSYCKLFYNILCGEKAEKNLWKPLVLHAFQSLQDRFKADCTWRDIFCHYSNAIKGISLAHLKMIESGNLEKAKLLKHFDMFKEHLLLPDSNRIAQYCLGAAYISDLKFDIRTIGFKYTKLSAKQGFINAQLKLGWIYTYGVDVKKNQGKAFKYYKRAADQESAEARHKIAVRYKEGNGTAENQALAFNYFKLAADQGHAESQYQTGFHLESGIGVEQNLKEAFNYFKLAADCKHATAQFKVSCFYQKGYGTKQEAFKYMELSAEQGYSEALYHLAGFYECGFHTSQDYNLAFKYYRLAANKNVFDASSKANYMVDFISNNKI